ncbi:nuclease A inhibitor family protein [Pontibacter harenae]|uniref:nuclease A inhibitor family protein n=1 Tax=Pontibacter harenae TaxID=2894083 RepID=UPI001E5FA820|nr:nuclease A inhibitor family protein [Pontibacter harenae]MCC9165638.1 nuclease A inhibitor family protein [Pontibacter harenae]
MDNTDISTANLLEGLRQQSEGLFYVSETDATFEVVHFSGKDGSEPTTTTELLAWAGKAEEEKVEVVELQYFFRKMTNETEDMSDEEKLEASRFQKLQAFIEQHLQQTKVYRVGERKITAFILGKASTGELLGLKTILVET